MENCCTDAHLLKTHASCVGTGGSSIPGWKAGHSIQRMPGRIVSRSGEQEPIGVDGFNLPIDGNVADTILRRVKNLKQLVALLT